MPVIYLHISQSIPCVENFHCNHDSFLVEITGTHRTVSVDKMLHNKHCCNKTHIIITQLHKNQTWDWTTKAYETRVNQGEALNLQSQEQGQEINSAQASDFLIIHKYITSEWPATVNAFLAKTSSKLQNTRSLFHSHLFEQH